eukprot:970728-Prorocentrum_minimum.AAC.3
MFAAVAAAAFNRDQAARRLARSTCTSALTQQHTPGYTIHKRSQPAPPPHLGARRAWKRTRRWGWRPPSPRMRNRRAPGGCCPRNSRCRSEAVSSRRTSRLLHRAGRLRWVRRGPPRPARQPPGRRRARQPCVTRG